MAAGLDLILIQDPGRALGGRQPAEKALAITGLSPCRRLVSREP
jgi:hypothetical protein